MSLIMPWGRMEDENKIDVNLVVLRNNHRIEVQVKKKTN